jgi:hypothetical protein
MPDRTVTPANISPPESRNAEIHGFLSDDPAATTVGRFVYVKANRKVAVADANGGGVLFQTVGIVVQLRGSTASVLKRGWCEGIDVENMTPGAPLFLSDTPGGVSDTPSATKVVPVGRAMPCTDGGPDVRMMAYIDIPWAALVP